MKFLNVGLITVMSLALIVVTFVMGFETIIFSKAYFSWHYEHRNISDTSGMTYEDLMAMTDQMLDYLKDKEPTLDRMAMVHGNYEEVFGEIEKAHMVDVKDLYQNAVTIKNIGYLILLACLLVSLKYKKTIGQAMLKVHYATLLFMIGIGVLAGLFATNFNKYFTIFHEVFFDNDMWILNPRTDVLINMVPEVYFYSIVMIGVVLFVLYLFLAHFLLRGIGRILQK